jgi:hypothetical protein
MRLAAGCSLLMLFLPPPAAATAADPTPQTATQWHAGDNVGTGTDYTLFSTVDGIVIYSKKPDRNLVGPALMCGRLSGAGCLKGCLSWCVHESQAHGVLAEQPKHSATPLSPS